MIAKVAVWEPMPTDDRQWVIDAAKTVPGYLRRTTLLAQDHSTHSGVVALTRGLYSKPFRVVRLGVGHRSLEVVDDHLHFLVILGTIDRSIER